MTRAEPCFQLLPGPEAVKRDTHDHADLRFNDFRPATETEVIIAGEETLLKHYTYEQPAGQPRP
ncbi:MAG: hypothetical protein ACLT8E_01300 [Akkermansia sp.]